MVNTTTAKKEVKRGRPTAANRKKHPNRVPMSGSRLRMEIPEEDKDPAFFYKWIGDDGKGFLHRAKQAGFAHCETSEFPTFGYTDVDSSAGTDSVISMPGGAGVTMYLMKQAMEHYLEDKEDMAKLVDAREADMKKSLNSGKEGTYGKVDFS